MKIYFSELDSARFGFRIAQAKDLTGSDLEAALEYCGRETIDLLMVRVPGEGLDTVQELEAAGFILTDTLLYYGRSVENLPERRHREGLTVRPVRPGEEDAVKRIAGPIFSGYQGHYHMDPRLDRDRADAVYPDWAYRSCVDREVADEVLVADLGGAVSGFATLRLNSGTEGEGVLFGVAPEVQGKGVYRSFIVEGLHWCRSRGLARMVVSTQITNYAVQKVWVRTGFEPYRCLYTLHKWFDG